MGSGNVTRNSRAKEHPMRKLLAILAAAVLGLGLAVASTLPAAAKQVYDDGVGVLTAYYTPSPAKDYTGVKQPAYDGYCVYVQRKTLSTQQWTTAGVQDYSDCQASNGSSGWAIRDDTYVSNTTAIRLYRPGTGGYVLVCVTKTECLAM